MNSLDISLSKIKSFFKENTFIEAHQLSNPTLLELAKDTNSLSLIIDKELSKDGFWERKRINPVIGFTVEENADFALIAHIWFPLPDRSEEITHQSIHHHGDLLLTSVAPFGSGYSSILFDKGFDIDKTTNIAKLRGGKFYRNHLHNIEFCDTNTPHVVFYPKDLSITFALWSNSKRKSVDIVKKNPFLQRNKKLLKKILNAMGLLKHVGVNVVEYFDFYVKNGEIIALPERKLYPVGTNENYIQNAFYIFQCLNYKNTKLIENSISNTKDIDSRNLAKTFLEKFINNESISDKFDPIHLEVPFINLKKTDVFKATQPKIA